MKKLFERNEILFSLLCICVYYGIFPSLWGQFKEGSPWIPVLMFVPAAGIAGFLRANNLTQKYGLHAWPSQTKRYLYFFPLWLLAAGNLLGGIHPHFRGIKLLWAILSMILTGFTEEVLYRGFLFKSLRSRMHTSSALLLSALIFSASHLLNLFSGQAVIFTALQVVFSFVWGAMLGVVFECCGSLYPCIFAHGLLNVFSLFSTENLKTEATYLVFTFLLSAGYCLYLTMMKRKWFTK